MNGEYRIYFLLAIAGAIAGFIRFYESKKNWSFRVAVSSSLVGSIISLSIIGYFFEEIVIKHPARALALALAIGYIQPNIASVVKSSLGLKDKDD